MKRGIYATRIFPWLLDRLLGNEEIGRLRRESLRTATGRTLEIGFGTGLNLPHFPPTVTELTLIDSEQMLDDLVAARIAAAELVTKMVDGDVARDSARRPVRRMQLDAQGRLPFADGTFDCVVSTFTLCSIEKVGDALAEIRRVLRPCGSFIFLEHGRSDQPKVAVWQDRLNPLQQIVGVGCNMNRRIDHLITASGLSLDHLDRFLLPQAPRLLGEIYRGVAHVRPS